MPKALCMSGLVISLLVFTLFFLDLLFGTIGLRWLAPFKRASFLMDIVFVAAAVTLGVMSWRTYKEQP